MALLTYDEDVYLNLVQYTQKKSNNLNVEIPTHLCKLIAEYSLDSHKIHARGIGSNGHDVIDLSEHEIKKHFREKIKFCMESRFELSTIDSLALELRRNRALNLCLFQSCYELECIGEPFPVHELRIELVMDHKFKLYLVASSQYMELSWVLGDIRHIAGTEHVLRLWLVRVAGQTAHFRIYPEFNDMALRPKVLIPPTLYLEHRQHLEDWQLLIGGVPSENYNSDSNMGTLREFKIQSIAEGESAFGEENFTAFWGQICTIL